MNCFNQLMLKLNVRKTVQLSSGTLCNLQRSISDKPTPFCMRRVPFGYCGSKTFSSSSNLLAGHSHYENTRHIKAAKDAAKRDVLTRIGLAMKSAIQEGKSNDPTKNNQLNTILQKCRKQNVSKSFIDKILKEKSMGEEFLIEIAGPGGSSFRLLYASNNQKNVRMVAERALKTSTFKGEVTPHGGTDFSKKRIILTTAEVDGKQMSEEDATDFAIEVGAEDVQLLNDEENYILKFTCNEFGYAEVEKAIEEVECGITILSSKFEHIPGHTVDLNETDTTAVQIFIRTLVKHNEKYDFNVKMVDAFHNVNDDFTKDFTTTFRT